jgi:hypothetical protein
VLLSARYVPVSLSLVALHGSALKWLERKKRTIKGNLSVLRILRGLTEHYRDATFVDTTKL